jgi:hypothetical protein
MLSRSLEASCATLWWKWKWLLLFVVLFRVMEAPVEWNGQGKTEVLFGKTCPSATLSTTNPTWTDRRSNPCLCSGRPAANRLSHGTTQGLVTSEEGLCSTEWPYLQCNTLQEEGVYPMNGKVQPLNSWLGDHNWSLLPVRVCLLALSVLLLGPPLICLITWGCSMVVDRIVHRLVVSKFRMHGSLSPCLLYTFN